MQKYFRYHCSNCVDDVRRSGNSTLSVFMAIKGWIAVLFSCGFIALLIHPALTALVNPSGNQDIIPWDPKLFKPIACFLNFSIFIFIGCKAINVFQINANNSKLAIATAFPLRILSACTLIFCNTTDRKILPVLFQSDVLFMVFIAVFGFLDGYFATNAYIATSELVSPLDQEIAGIIAAASIILGCVTGSLCNPLLISLL